MKLDKLFVIFIVFISFAVTGVLHYMRSPEKQRTISYLAALENSLSVFGEGKTSEYKLISNQLTPDVINDIIIPIGYFVEEQRIIEEFNNEKQIKSILCRDELSDYISFYISLTNDINVYSDAHELQKREAKLSNTIFSVACHDIRTVNTRRLITHKIMANDSLYKLAKKYYNDESKWDKIYQANRNKMSNPHSLQIGQELLIPITTASSKGERDRIIKT